MNWGRKMRKPLLAWASTRLLYGFGELIDKVCDIEKNTRGGERKREIPAKGYDELNAESNEENDVDEDDDIDIEVDTEIKNLV